MRLGWLGYLGAFGASLVLAWVLTPVVLRLALRRGALDEPGGHKAHASPMPYLGGVAIVIAFAVAILAAAVVYNPPSELDTLAVLLAVGVGLSLVGLLDDVRGLPAWPRLLAQLGAGAAVWATGSGTTAFGPDWANMLVTVVWVVGITNALNLLDNMDGLSAGIAAIAAAAFFVVAALNGQFLMAGLSAAVAGCSLGFLRHNFHPARIYMGDAGSLFLGFLLAVIGVRLRLTETPQAVAVFVPVLVLGVALFDTALVVFNRMRHGRNPLLGGRDHTSHRLVYVGVPVPAAVGLLYAGGLGLGWLGLILPRLDAVSGLLLVGLTFAVGMFAFVLLSFVPVYDNSRRRKHMVQVVREHEPEPVASPSGQAADQPVP